jgi:hypothetical protein
MTNGYEALVERKLKYLRKACPNITFVNKNFHTDCPDIEPTPLW